MRNALVFVGWLPLFVLTMAVVTPGCSQDMGQGMGPLGWQADIFPYPPGDEAYRPLRAVTLVTWKDEASARVLKSLTELQGVIDSGAVSVEESGVVPKSPQLNVPFAFFLC